MKIRTRHFTHPALAMAALCALGKFASAAAYYFDVNGTAAGFGLTSGSTYTLNGTNQYFNTDSTGGSAGVVSATTATPTLSSLSGDTVNFTNGGGDYSYTLNISQDRWFARFDPSPGITVAKTYAFTGTGAVNMLSGIIITGGFSTGSSFTLGNTTNLYGTKLLLSTGSGRTSTLNGAVTQAARMVLQFNNGTLGTDVLASTTGITTNGVIYNGIYYADGSNASNLMAYATRDSLTGIIGSITGTAATASTWANVNTASTNYDSASSAITLGAAATANTVRITTTTGANTIDLNGFNLTLNGLMSGVVSGSGSLTINATGLGQIKIGSTNELVFLTSKALTVNPVIANNGSNASSVSILATTGTPTSTLAGANTYTGSTNISSGSLNISAANNVGTGTFASGAYVVLNSATLKASTSTALSQGLKTAPYTTDVLDGTAGTSVLSAGGVTTGAQSRLTIQNAASFSTSGQVNLGSGSEFLANNSIGLTMSGGITGSGTLLFGNNGLASSSATGSLSGTSTGFTGGMSFRAGTFTIDSSVTTGTMTSFGTNKASLIIAGTVNDSLIDFKSLIIGDQSGSDSSSITIQSGGTLNVTRTGGNEREFAIANGAGANNGLATVDVAGTLSIANNVNQVGIGGDPFRSNSTSTGTLNVNNGGLVSILGAPGTNPIILGANGKSYNAGSTTLNANSVQTGTINLNTGGTLFTSRTITKGIVDSGVSGHNTVGYIDFNGGTLKSNGTDANSSWVSGLTSMTIEPAGAIIDTNGTSMGFAQPLLVGATAGGGLTKRGAGVLTLSATTNTYTGSTTVSNGTLVITGALPANAKSKVFIAADPTGAFGTTDDIKLTRAASGSYVGYGATEVGGLASSAEILNGSNSSGSDTSLTMQWRQRSAAESTSPSSPPLSDGGGSLISDVLRLSDMVNSGAASGQTDPFVLSMSYDPSLLPGGASNEATLAAKGDIYMVWLDPVSGYWKPATKGNFGGTPTFVLGAYDSTAYSLSIGTYGVDTTTHTAWAILNHNSDFAVIPEPSVTSGVIVGALITTVSSRRRRKGK